MHAPLHTVNAQLDRQVPLEHVVPAGPTTPQPPQLRESDCTPMQTPPHNIAPKMHPPQVPFEHTVIGPQARPHAPQFAGFVRRLTSQPSDSTELQLAKPVSQTRVHAPLLHCRG